ncbi:MAG TPA: proline--tRNA ligase, partial [Rhodospirillaceae bacterium]|nr:proline--tRNA ligase [Rhodospirillaceae bacterium]
GISARVDASEARSSDKMWTAIKKGVPVRLEIGARELAEGQVVFTRRDLGKDGKMKVSIDSCAAEIGKALQQMQKDLLARSRARLASQITDVKTLKDVRDYYAADKTGGLRLDYALVKDSPEFAAIAKEYAVTTRCLPFADGGEKVIVAKSY